MNDEILEEIRQVSKEYPDGIHKVSEHNKNFYSLEELKRTRDSLEGFSDNEEAYYFVGAIRYACDEIERLNNIINGLNNAYCRVITKCEEMINSRFYMNDNAIKNYAGEIINICKYYVGEAKEILDKENK